MRNTRAIPLRKQKVKARNTLINRVVIADVVALVCLLAATALYVLQRRNA